MDIGNWQLLVEEETGKNYYYNVITGTTSWDVPPVSPWQEMVDETTGNIYYYNNETGESSWNIALIDQSAEQTVAPEVLSLSSLPDHWVEAVTEDGYTYYYNEITNATSYERPTTDVVNDASLHDAVYDEVVVSSESAVDISSEWVAATDPSTGMIYYYHAITNEVSWDNPYPTYSGSEFNQETQSDSYPVIAETPHPTGLNMSLFDAETLNLPSYLKEGTGKGKTEVRVNGYVVAPDVRSDHTPAYNNSASGDSSDSTSNENDILYLKASEVFKTINSDMMWSDFADSLLTLDHRCLESHIVIEELYKLLSSFRMEKYAEIFFQYDRRGINNLTSTLDKLLSFQSDFLKLSLTSLSADMNAEALMCFRYISAFIGSKNINGSHLELTNSLISKMLQASSELHDEIYCQICKQIRKNPNADSAELGCQLILICLISFPPSRRLLPYMLNFLCSYAKNPSVSESAQKFVYMAVKLCFKSSISAVRKEHPTNQEVQALLLGDMTEVSFQTIDGNTQKCELDSFTTIKQLEVSICMKLGLTDVSRPLFALYESNVESGEVIALNADDRVMDIVALRTTQVNSNQGQQQPQQQTVIGIGSTSSFDAITSVSGGSRMLPPSSLPALSSPVKSSNSNSGASVAVHLFYAQATHDVVSAHYPHTLQDAMMLAAIQLQEQLGDHILGRELVILRGRSLFKFIYKHFITDHTRAEIEAKIMQIYKSLAGMSANESRMFYIAYVRCWATYGGTYFVVKGQENIGSTDELQSVERVLAITSKMLILIDISSNSFIAEYHYPDIVSWGHSFDSFVLVTGSKSSPVKSYFKTLQGGEIDSLLRVYGSRPQNANSKEMMGT